MNLYSNVTVYTVGHSNLSTEDLLYLLQSFSIDVVVDIRAYPQSKRFPHFNGDVLRHRIEANGLVYHWAGRQLGGMRKPTPGYHSPHIALQSEFFRAFADYMETAAFQKAVQQLCSMAAASKVSLLCAERLAHDCHRSLISDYLLLQGAKVLHISAANTCYEHQLSEYARRESQQLIYDRAVSGQLDF
ncbi:MAG: DUF488 domain-containing protein [Gammaproteobacteria bacterium]|nr:DUF488 domain-containing protein [Gammaproteobacteria bacterium]MDH5801405.1 DUF488 domain-containing protein [Gammaproteobacteria bacterium]